MSIKNKRKMYTYIFFQHGRVKVRTTAEQEEIKKRERAAKVAQYKADIATVFQKVLTFSYYVALSHT